MTNFNFPDFSRFSWSVTTLNSQYNKINDAFKAFKSADEVLSISEMTIFRISLLMQYYNIVYILFAFSIKLIVMRILKPVTTYNHGTHINGK